MERPIRQFSYQDSPDPIRPDLGEAHRRTWAHIAAAGTWLTGAERVAVAEETRRARSCALCAERKAALSPFGVKGVHDHAGALSAALVDEVHRITSDPQRLTQAWHESLLAEDLCVEQYVEALGVAVLAISIDEFHRALGLALEPLPEAQSGEPSRNRPPSIGPGEAWVPMMDLKRATPEERGLVPAPGPRVPNVLRALSLVPAQVSAWVELAGSQYLSPEKMLAMETGRAIDRSQIELVAGRVSALNECFY